MTRILNGVAVAAMLASLAACGGEPTPPPSPASSPPGSTVANITKVLVFVVENHSLDQMRERMPFTAHLGDQFGYATNYKALTHPSLPNYLAMTGGSTYGVTDDAPPSTHPVHGQSVFGQAVGVGKSAKLYAEGMPSACATSSEGRYAVRHNPWAYHVDEISSCSQYDVPLGALSADSANGQLPNAGMVIPDLCNDAHDCDLSVADSWLRAQVGDMMAGPDWKSGHLLVVVTADEDDHHQDNFVLTTLAHPALDGAVVTSPLTHYSLARLYSEILRAEPIGQAASATSMLAAFGLTLPAT